MKITFDSVKDANNQVKHGLSLDDAFSIDWDTLLAIEDTRHDYGEVRMIGYALLGRGCIAWHLFTDRANKRLMKSK